MIEAMPTSTPAHAEQYQKRIDRVDVEMFMDAAVLLGTEFLSCGGPITRLESQIALAGRHAGFLTTVHATPTAISIYCHIPTKRASFSRAASVESFGVNLSLLRSVDNILSRFALGELQPEQIMKRLTVVKKRIKLPSVQVHYACLFSMGAGAGLLMGAGILSALIGGAFTTFIGLVVRALTKYVVITPIFTDFLRCLLAFLFSSLLASLLVLPAKILALGTLVYVVPGLLLTTAISEIVDQNYLSGTIRLLKALCTFLTMALAYFLATELAAALDLDAHAVVVSVTRPSFIEYISGSTLILLSASIEFCAHRKSLIHIVICGLIGATCYYIAHSPTNLAIPHFCAAFAIGAVSFRLGRLYRHPSQIYSVPSILILAPGMLAFTSFGYGGEDVSLPSILKAALISLSIVMGLAAGRLPFTFRKHS